MKEGKMTHTNVKSFERFKILDDVKKTLTKREIEHGNPKKTFYELARRWKMLPHEVCMLLADLKLERWRSNPANIDNYRDAIGYLALAFELMKEVDQFGQTIKNSGRGDYSYEWTPEEQVKKESAN